MPPPTLEQLLPKPAYFFERVTAGEGLGGEIVDDGTIVSTSRAENRWQTLCQWAGGRSTPVPVVLVVECRVDPGPTLVYQPSDFSYMYAPRTAGAIASAGNWLDYNAQGALRVRFGPAGGKQHEFECDLAPGIFQLPPSSEVIVEYQLYNTNAVPHGFAVKTKASLAPGVAPPGVASEFTATGARFMGGGGGVAIGTNSLRFLPYCRYLRWWVSDRPTQDTVLAIDGFGPSTVYYDMNSPAMVPNTVELLARSFERNGAVVEVTGTANTTVHVQQVLAVG